MAEMRELRTVRARKRRAFLRAGVPPYPEQTPPHRSIAEIHREFPAFVRRKTAVGLAGRIVGLRTHGGAMFLDCRDGSDRIQIFLSRNDLGPMAYARIGLLDLGDFVFVRGRPFLTRRKERSIRAASVTVLAKALRPLPDAWYGLHDVDERFRKREVDLLLNPGVLNRFHTRSLLLSALRRDLDRAGFLEVETPMLQPVPGGAVAEPFKTTLKALSLPLYLRIAPELYLKRLLVGGFEKVFEIGRAFRNEGIDSTHNPEFTILEFYWAYQDLNGLMRFSERLLRSVVRATARSIRLSFRGETIDFGKPFARHDFCGLFRKSFGIDPITASEQDIRSAAHAHGIPVKGAPRWSLVDHLTKKVIVPSLRQPCFLTGHPLALSPLAKASRENPAIAARFQMIVGGMEIANAYAELNDPVEQRERFREETRKRREGDREAHRPDEDFLTALEYGMPPAAGFGLGVDRLAMLLTDAPSLREVLLFPTMRPKPDRRRRTG